MGKKVLLSILLIMCVMVNLVSVNASDALNKIINQGTNFGKGNSTSMATTIKSFFNNDIIPAIGAIGNLIFAAVTVVLGAKYIWSSAEGRADVMESLPTFVIALVFFYLSESVFNLVKNSSANIMSATSWTTVSGYVIFIINKIVQYVAFGGVVFIGIKYMLSSAEGKASVKTSLGGLMLGLLFVFATTNVINFVVTASGQIIK